VITGAEARHIARVLRHRPGDRVRVTDGRGTEYQLELAEVRHEKVTGLVRARAANLREPRHRLTLALAALKGEKLVQACEQAAELGISEFLPFRSERTIARLSPARVERLRHVAVSALKSSTRTVLPAIGEPVDLSALIRRVPEFDQSLVAYEEETGVGLERVLNRSAKSVLAIVGPEGGFAPEEIDRLRAAGVVSFSLGPRRLRAETAAVSVVAGVLQLLGDLG
jgi:16S rRNA (uracil1498-N3)-methyltransferase